jgi:hypothetical protein
VTDVDVAIIGSSPLLLIQAIKDARAGKKVALFEADHNLGGLWRTETLPDGSLVECACHLIESFPGVYEILSDISGMPFVDLEPQPYRIEMGDKPILYASRKTVAAIALMSLYRLTKISLKAMTKSLNQSEQEICYSARLKLTDFWRFTWRQLLTGVVVKGPIFGFGRFIDNLLKFAKQAGVQFVLDEVKVANRFQQCWKLQVGQEFFSAKHVYCSASATLVRTCADRFEAEAANLKDSFHLVVEVPKSSVHKQLSYVSFTKDPYIFRISRLDQPDKGFIHWKYLIQLRNKVIGNGESELGKVIPALKKIGFILQANDVKLLQVLKQSYRPYFANNQLPDGELAPNFVVLSSAGNLASGVAAWSRGVRRLPWRPLSYEDIS